MKSVLISIQPKWCVLIANGEKTIEVRKTRPKLQTPFKCYIYCTKQNGNFVARAYGSKIWLGMGKVIGEFVCDRIYKYKYDYCDHPEIGYPVGYDCGDNWYEVGGEDLQKMGLTYEEFKQYGNGKTLYGWHISDLKIYDEPKELGEFRRTIICKTNKECTLCENGIKKMVDRDCEFSVQLTRPPQSWCYVEAKE